MINIRRADPTSTDAVNLLTAGHRAMQSLFPAKRKVEFSVDALVACHIYLFLAYLDDVPVGCCAASNEADYSELKKLFVLPEARGYGAAAALVYRAEETARAAQNGKVMLESGAGLHAAHRLYLRLGYKRRDAFGAHEDLPTSLFFEKALAP
ncbi:MAG: GNAT family N-acetyltransferase [Pseudomonadota bacterium]